MRRTSLLSVLAIVASLAVAAFAVTPAIGDGGSATATASAKKKGKKCGKKKKGKKSVATAAKKKCGKKKGKNPANLGPQMALGDYFCGHSGFQVLAGNRYTVNNADPGSYRYYPDTGIVQFQGGSYSWAFGKYDAQLKEISIYSNDASVIPVGEYGWTCYRL